MTDPDANKVVVEYLKKEIEETRKLVNNLSVMIQGDPNIDFAGLRQRIKNLEDFAQKLQSEYETLERDQQVKASMLRGIKIGLSITAGSTVLSVLLQVFLQ